MTANELRIGNFIMYSDIKKVFDVNLWFFTELDAKISYINDFEPIPLTEEWLLKFGFIKTKEYPEFKLYYQNNFDYRIELYIDGTCWLDELRELKSVHQLQNIYFALTENELTIN